MFITIQNILNERILFYIIVQRRAIQAILKYRHPLTPCPGLSHKAIFFNFHYALKYFKS